jgi:hypothetical protein
MAIISMRARGIEAAGRFVEQQDLGIVNEHARQAEPLLHAAAQRANQAPFFSLRPTSSSTSLTVFSRCAVGIL